MSSSQEKDVRPVTTARLGLAAVLKATPKLYPEQDIPPDWQLTVNCDNHFDETRFLQRLASVSGGTDGTGESITWHTNVLYTHKDGEKLRAKLVNYEHEDVQALRKHIDAELVSEFPSALAVRVSGLHSLTAETAPRIIRDLKVALEEFGLEAGYLSILRGAGPLLSSTLTSYRFGAKSWTSPELGELRYTLRTIWITDSPADKLRWGLNNVTVYHNFRRLGELHAVSLVIEDRGSEEIPKTQKWTGLDSLDQISDLENLRYCEMALEGWGIVLDELEQDIWDATTDISLNGIRTSNTEVVSSTNLTLLNLQIAIECNKRTISDIRDAFDRFALRTFMIRQNIPSMTKILELHLTRITWLLKLNEDLRILHANVARSQEHALQTMVAENVAETRSIAFGTAKLNYLSQNYLRGTAYLVILFLPGIFVSALLSSGVFSDHTPFGYLQIWLGFALPFTFLSVALLQFLWVEPILKDTAKQHLNARGIPATLSQVMTKFKYPGVWYRIVERSQRELERDRRERIERRKAEMEEEQLAMGVVQSKA